MDVVLLLPKPSTSPPPPPPHTRNVYHNSQRWVGAMWSPASTLPKVPSTQPFDPPDPPDTPTQEASTTIRSGGWGACGCRCPPPPTLKVPLTYTLNSPFPSPTTTIRSGGWGPCVCRQPPPLSTRTHTRHVYHNSQRCLGAIWVPASHWKAFAKGAKLARGPFTRYWLGFGVWGSNLVRRRTG